MKPLITIVIPTFNRLEVLMEALRAIQRQSLKNFEVIVVENGFSRDNTREQVQKLAKVDKRFIYVWTTAENGDFGSRNIGCRQARADIILSNDDDWEMTDPDTLVYIVRCFNEDKKLGVLAISEYYPDGKAKGKIVPCATPRNWKGMLRNTSLYHSGKINRWGMIGARFYYLPMGQKHQVDHVRSSCMAFRREVAQRFGYFPTFYLIEQIGIGYRSETELCRRFAEAGYDVVFSSEIQGLHKMHPRQPGILPRSQKPEFFYATGRNNMLFFLRNYWSRSTSFIFFLWDLLVGNSSQPGLIRFLIFPHLRSIRNALASLKGKFRGFIDYHTKYHDIRRTT